MISGPVKNPSFNLPAVKCFVHIVSSLFLPLQGLKCGGTLEERAKRLFVTKGKNLSELDPSLFAKKKTASASSKAREAEKQKEVAAMEAQIYKFSEILSEQRLATKENVERKQARTDMERDDSDNELSEDEPEEEDDDDIPYNPKNLPLGMCLDHFAMVI